MIVFDKNQHWYSVLTIDYLIRKIDGCWMSFMATNVTRDFYVFFIPISTWPAAAFPKSQPADQYLKSAFNILNQALGEGPYLNGDPNLQQSLKETLALEGVARVFEENDLI